jgi:hypothetical protein
MSKRLEPAPTAVSLGGQNSLFRYGPHLYQKPGLRLGDNSEVMGIDFRVFTATLDLVNLGTGE